MAALRPAVRNPGEKSGLGSVTKASLPTPGMQHPRQVGEKQQSRTYARGTIGHGRGLLEGEGSGAG